MAESKEAVRERVRRFRALKKELGVKTAVTEAPLPIVAEVTESVPIGRCQYGCERMLREGLAAFSGQVADIRYDVEDLQNRLKEVERQLSPEELTRREAMKPGGRPNALYGA
jgi:hypothetical protein